MDDRAALWVYGMTTLVTSGTYRGTDVGSGLWCLVS